MSFQGKFKTRALDSIMLGGDLVPAARAGAAANVNVLLYNAAGKVMIAYGTAVPADATAGYVKGCLFIDTDVGAGSTGIYENVGTLASCDFDPIGSKSEVALATLAAGITPSHVVKFAGEVTWSGDGASLATTVTGVLATDIVVASIQTVPTQAAYLVSAAATEDTLTFVLSAANTSNDAVISYMVLRAAA